MTTFAYKAYRADGGVETGEIDANSASDALNLLCNRGLLPYETLEARHRPSASHRLSLLSRENRLSQRQMAELTRELAVLLKASLPLDHAMRLIASGESKPQVAAASERMLKHLMAGDPFSSAVRKCLPEAPPIVHSLLLAGESHGNLATAVESIAVYLERRVASAQKVRSTLTYPLFLAATAIVTTAIVVSVLVPSLMPLFDNAGRDPPWILAAANSVSNLFTQHWFYLVGFAMICGAVLVFASTSRSTASLRETLQLALPIVGPLKSERETALMAHTLGTLLKNGVPLVAALETTRKVMSTHAFQAALETTTERVKEGGSLHDALRQTARFPEFAIRFATVGEESSRLDEMLLHLASTLEAQLERRLERLMTMLGPAMTVLIGVVVGGLILSVMQAVLSANEFALK